MYNSTIYALLLNMYYSFILKRKKTNLYYLSNFLNRAIKISNGSPSHSTVTEHSYLFGIYDYKLNSRSIKFFFHNTYFLVTRRNDSKRHKTAKFRNVKWRLYGTEGSLHVFLIPWEKRNLKSGSAALALICDKITLPGSSPS